MRLNAEYEVGESKLTAVNDLLGRINYTGLTITENGMAMARPYQSPEEREIEHYYLDDSLSVLLPDAEEEFDIFDTPNVFVRTVSNPEAEDVYRAEFINDNPSSALSTVSRGRKIVDYEELTDISSQAALDIFVRRIAFEKSQTYSKIRFKTALMPHHTALDMLYLRHENLSVEGKFTETSWQIELEAGGRMSHEARRLVII